MDGSEQESVTGILVVEDERPVRELIEEILEDLPATIPYVLAESGDAAMRLVEQGLRPQLLITNVRMPGEMDGLELARTLRRRLPHLGVIVISGDTAYIDESDELRDAHLLRKPFRVQDMQEIVQRLLQRGQETTRSRGGFGL